MTNREVAWGAGALLVGMVVAGLVYWRLRSPGLRPAAPDAATAGAEVTPLAPLEPEPAPDEPSEPAPDGQAAPPRPVGAHDASARDATRGVVHASGLLIHPVSNEQLCVDASSHGNGIQLYACHGRKNQRWTVAEDPGGVMRISGAEGACLHVGEARAEVAAPLELGGCGAEAATFRHGEDRRFRDVRSGQCITARRVEAHTKLVLEACDASSAGQAWSIAR